MLDLELNPEDPTMSLLSRARVTLVCTGQEREDRECGVQTAGDDTYHIWKHYPDALVDAKSWSDFQATYHE